jgi:hypothetical protein
LRINEIWELPLLKKRVREVQAKLKEGENECFLDENGNMARMIEMISPISYHQAEEIAGFLGMGYEQSGLNEDELETLNWAVKMRMENLLEELRGHIKPCREFAFSFAYDPDGNFGLILSLKKLPAIHYKPQQISESALGLPAHKFQVRSPAFVTPENGQRTDPQPILAMPRNCPFSQEVSKRIK